MIRRVLDNSFCLINQIDHAKFSGEIAKHLAGHGFSSPSPHHEVLQAITHHDDGWSLHDDHPTLNTSGHPLDVFEIPTSLAVTIWSASVDRALPLGPYTALLVSLHQMALTQFATPSTTKDHFELNKFQHRQVELQETLRRHLNLRLDLPLQLGLAQNGIDPAEDLLRFNFHLLTLCDRLSLQLCCGKPLFPTIDIHPRPGQPLISIHTRFLDDWTLILTPWPFDAHRIEFSLPARRINSRQFRDAADLHSTLQTTPTDLIIAILQPA